MSVLIVDDNAVVRGALRCFLDGREGLRVCGEAFDGAEAVAKAADLQPDLVIMDLSMPNMNGAQAAWTIRQSMPGARIVLFTLYPDLMRKAFAKVAGVDIVVPKAEGAGALMKALEPWLGSCSVGPN